MKSRDSLSANISKHAAKIRVILLMALFIASAWWSHYKVDIAREEYQSTSIETTGTEPKEDVTTKEADKNVSAEIVKQSEQFRGWSVLILGGIVAISVTTKVHRSPLVGWAYLPLGPAGIFLVNSLHAGWIVGKRYTFLVATGNYSDFGSIANLLQVQSDLFLYSVICVSLFAGWFLFQIVLGKIQPFEAEKKG